jgi:cytochrome o ubiquinol oxidase subunit 1
VGTLLPASIVGHHHQDARTGMGMMKMPIFTWTALCTNILIVASFPVLTAVLAPAVHGPLPGHRLPRTTLAATR